MVLYILYPLLFSLIPIFTFLSSNLKEIDKKSILFIFLIDIISILGLWSILTYVVKLEGNISSGILFYLIILFYTPWYKLNRFKSRYAYQYIIKYIIYAILVCSIVAISFMPLVLTIIFTIVIVLNIIYIISNISQLNSEYIKQNIVDINVGHEDKPDIYHIILDGYLGREALKDYTGFYNDDFYNKLKSMGFETHNNIYSNYNYTVYSISSILNMDYFHNYMSSEELSSDMYLKDKLSYGFFRAIYSKLVLSLKKAGYKIIIRGETIFSESIQNLCHTVVDVQSSQSYAINANATIITFLKTTVISKFFMISRKASRDHAAYLKRVFQELGNDHKMQSPAYSLYHILAPHPPFCFNRDGTINEKYSSMIEYPAYDKDVLEAYKNHMLCINDFTIDAVKKLIDIIKIKNRKAVILIHSDHGLLMTNPSKAGYNTLLALYKYKFDDDTEIFKENMTLVNIMPLLFNYLFNTNIALNEDKFYFCPIMQGNFVNEDITDEIIKFIK